jgi:hypothetical protein
VEIELLDRMAAGARRSALPDPKIRTWNTTNFKLKLFEVEWDSSSRNETWIQAA